MKPLSASALVVGRLLAMYVLLGLLWFSSTRLLSGEFWQALIALAALLLPLALYGLYEAAIAKTLRRERYLRDGIFFRLFSGRFFLGIVILALVFIAAPLLLLRLHVLPAREWWLLALLVPLQMLVFRLLVLRLQVEYKPWLMTAAALDWARFLCPTLMGLIYAPLLLWQPAPGIDLTTVLANARDSVADIDSSVALATLAQLVALFDGSRNYFLGAFDTGLQTPFGRFVFAAALLDFWILCYFVCRVQSVLLLPRVEWRRVFGPLWDDRQVPPLAPARIAIATALCVFAAMFVAVPGLASLEAQVRARPALQQVLAGAQLRVERIGNEYFAPGTIEALERSRRVALARMEISTAQLLQKIDAAFAAMAGNVDVYLDWYYSLGAEYARIGHLLAGDLDDYMARKFAETLAQQDALREVEAALAASLVNSTEASSLYQRLVEALLAQNRIDTSGRQVDVTRAIALPDIVSTPEHRDLLTVQSRLLASGGGAVAGVVGGAIAGKLVAKVVTKSSFKLATQALAKFVAGKAAGASLGVGAGAATGGALGSVVPGFGTVLGALIGGAIGGLAVGIGVDAALIEFEEAVGREAFRAELLDALEETRREYLQSPDAGR
ncbi:MAG: hypothetical protein RLZZ227_2801 [Pseudomonadota bacterium]|jgi:hypothetical protein